MPSGGSCLLGSLNIAEFVTPSGDFDFDGLSEAAFTATVALNRVLDEGLPLHPLQEQLDSVRDWRQIGLGVMGVADMLIKMGVTYGSEESLELCKSISNCILNSAIYASVNLASIDGPFPMYDHDSLIKSEFYQQNISDENKKWIEKHGLRNSQLLTIAPTGTLSTMIGVSGGVEPIFASHYMRKTESLFGEDRYFKVYTPIVKRYMDAHSIEDESKLPVYFVYAPDIKPIDRIKMQSVWQQNIDASISSTVNLPNSATVEDIENIYIEAWKHGLKGITVFRDNCSRAAILTSTPPKEADKPEDEKIKVAPAIPRGFILDASDNLIGKKRKLMTGCGSLHCTAFFDPTTGDLMETYLSRGSTGGCANSYTGLSRMISLAARAGVGIDAIIDQLDSCGACPSYAVRRATRHDTSPGACCPIAIGKALKDMWLEMQSEIADDGDDTDVGDDNAIPTTPIGEILDEAISHVPAMQTPKTTCPECGEPIIHEGGCDICKNCGWSKCS